ncbi:hypothetical protein PROFUN_09894 [Planoprotostelium fungivorum]|uniref:Trafficking protein particle complex subunit n=1 Tax=Planoprotostelium fungivorum TaxID=1890364 RepID=A0A2P6NGH8_9EUKA|nr:hypothetical protein PROFUN_09894 [Planoprotostelium fungivorum]
MNSHLSVAQSAMKNSGSYSSLEQLAAKASFSEKRPQKPLPILSRPIPKGKSEVSLSAFSFLFSEFIQYSLAKVNNITELEKRLSDCGYNIGVRMLELITYREKNYKRETKLINMLTFISYTVWRILFSKQADLLEKSTDQDDEYMISENQSLPITKFISTPREYSGLNCASFVAGIVEGILDAAEFGARVSAHSMPLEGQKQMKTVILIKFNPDVIARSNLTA